MRTVSSNATDTFPFCNELFEQLSCNPPQSFFQVRLNLPILVSKVPEQKAAIREISKLAEGLFLLRADNKTLGMCKEIKLNVFVQNYNGGRFLTKLMLSAPPVFFSSYIS